MAVAKNPWRRVELCFLIAYAVVFQCYVVYHSVRISEGKYVSKFLSPSFFRFRFPHVSGALAFSSPFVKSRTRKVRSREK
jgi:hypothetical protein